jgi:hypothetical protein
MILFVLAIFILILLLHVLIIRLFKLHNQIFYLFSLFLGFPFLIFITLVGLNSHLKAFSLIYLFKAGLLYFSFACAYIQTFPAIQAFSPSLRILYLIGKTKGGLTEEEIRDNFSIGDLMTDRLDDLFTENYICEYQSRLYLKPKGKFLAVIFGTYRNILGLETGEG